jgi:hypothetical protein
VRHHVMICLRRVRAPIESKSSTGTRIALERRSATI